MSDDRVPVTMLSGFLGAGAGTIPDLWTLLDFQCSAMQWSDASIVSCKHCSCSATSCVTGKTTVLRHLLQNKADLRIGCIVNDVASINVDAKLLRNDRNRGRSQQPKSTADLTDTIELANGCACELCQTPAVRKCLAPVCADVLRL